MAFKIIDKDNGFRRFFANLKEMDQLVAVVGVLSPAAQEDHDGLTNADLMLIHEFGAPSANIPARSSLRSTVDENSRKYELAFNTAIQKMVFQPKSFRYERALTSVGEQAKRDVLAKIQSGIPPSLSQPYRARKVTEGFPSTPLIRTKQLIDSISTEVRKGRKQ